MAMEESKVTKMKTFIIQEKFVGYADIKSMQKPKMDDESQRYNRGSYQR